MDELDFRDIVRKAILEQSDVSGTKSEKKEKPKNYYES